MLNNPKRLAFFLPNIFTALNLACGFSSIILSMNGDMYKACMVLILGAIFDSVDGRVARMTGTQSQFGEQFDSISDVISFGVAPSFLIYNHFLHSYGRVGMVVTFIFLLCGALRLARFNANIKNVSSDYFQGLPIPGAAIAIIGYVFISLEFGFQKEFELVAFPYAIFFGILMISNIPFCSFKNSEWVRNHKRRVLAIIFLLLCSIFIYEQLMIGVIINLYVLGSLIYYITHRKDFVGIFEWKNEDENEEEHN